MISAEAEQKSNPKADSSISRRSVLRGAATLTALTALGVGCSNQEATPTSTDPFFIDNKAFPFDSTKTEPRVRYFTPEGFVRQIDQYFSQKTLSTTSLKEEVVPVWIDTYSRLLNSTVNSEAVLPRITYLSQPVTNLNQLRNAAWIDRDDTTFFIRGLTYNLGAFQSDKDYALLSVAPSKGIVYLRTAFLRQLAALDTSTRTPADLNEALDSAQLVDPGNKNPDVTFVNGFEITAKFSNRNYSAPYFTNFEQQILDIVADNVATKTKVDSLFFNGRSPILRDLLVKINLSIEKVVGLHQNSDVLEMARLLGAMSQSRRDVQTTAEQQRVDGFKIMQIFNDPRVDIYSLEKYFPGVSQSVLYKYFAGTR